MMTATVLPSPEVFPYSFRRQQAIRADYHAGPSMAAKDPERHPLRGPLVERPVLTRRPLPVLSTASTAINPGHIASLRENNRQNSAEGNRFNDMDNRHGANISSSTIPDTPILDAVQR
ncbi:hypothetical protein ARMSODRAFT_737584 [Armillaria solidipes]|uniref:Uncharacterized protein n=1 Tax=Armillaria solidipes TaxID=1076256 RepID=A0A2H3ATN5_9AGAR|nr:hypothetical protein ARMSODRAFT_737584 [Armillaria solidipes]